MKKNMLPFITCLILILILTTTTGALAAKKDEVPTRVKVIAQSCTADSLCLTVIDLDRNEIVILFYSSLPAGLVKQKLELSNVIRTGMFVDPDEQDTITGQDAPFEEKKEQFQDPNKLHKPHDMNNFGF